MNKEEKAAVVEEIATRLGEAGAIFAIDYRGISVVQAAELRSKLRENETSFTVVKNRLAKRAAEQAGTQGIDELFDGPTALALVKGDPVVAAKTIATFSREHDVLTYKGGLMDGAPLDADSFKTIARLPGLDVLRGQLVGLAASPLTGLVSGLGNMVSGLARQLSQIADQGLLAGAAPEAEVAAPEAEVAEEEAPTEEPEAVAEEEAPPEEPEQETKIEEETNARSEEDD